MNHGKRESPFRMWNRREKDAYHHIEGDFQKTSGFFPQFSRRGKSALTSNELRVNKFLRKKNGVDDVLLHITIATVHCRLCRDLQEN